MAASFVGYQMGFGTASLMVPDAGAPLSPFAAFHRIVFLLIFLLLNLHMFYIKALVDTLSDDTSWRFWIRSFHCRYNHNC